VKLELSVKDSCMLCSVCDSAIWDIPKSYSCSQLQPWPTHQWPDWLSRIWFIMGIPERMP